MDLHANAALSWSGRRELARRVVEGGWSLTAAAEAHRGQRPLRPQVGWPLPVGRSAAARSLVGAEDRRQSHTGRPGRGDREAAASADDRSGDRGDARDAAFNRFGRAHPRRDRTVGTDRSRASGALPALSSGRAHPDRQQKPRPQRGRRRPSRRRQDGRGQRRQYDTHGRRHGTTGWEFVHVAVDDYSRLAYAEVLPDERATTAAGFLRRARAFFARYGVHVERVLTDG
jgi:hypothetical protein